jgi:FtsP/CotA-like multicopper oxidase with cupredoxin domain
MDPGTAHQIEVDIPKDHPTGTFWYHPHVHGTVTYQFLGGMAGFLIVRGGPGTLDAVPEVAAAKDVVMAFQVIRTTHDGNTVFVQEKSEQFGTFPFVNLDTGFVPPLTNQGIWSTYGLDGGPAGARRQLSRPREFLLLHDQRGHQSPPAYAARRGAAVAAAQLNGR